MSDQGTGGSTAIPFVETKEYRRFAEFCDACRRDRYIGLCYGVPGVGKTLSARHYARWSILEALFANRRLWIEPPQRPDLADCRAIMYTPSMTTTPKRLEEGLYHLRRSLYVTVEAAQQAQQAQQAQVAQQEQYRNEQKPDTSQFDDRWTELVIVDEADRLNFASLEQLRDVYDRRGFGLVLIGMPGIEKRLSRYAQFYSRVGFVHQFRALSAEEMHFILEHKWRELGLSIDLTEFDDVEAMAAIIRITGGNFRLVQRLFSQMARVIAINGLEHVTKEVVEAARESLVIGTT